MLPKRDVETGQAPDPVVMGTDTRDDLDLLDNTRYSRNRGGIIGKKNCTISEKIHFATVALVGVIAFILLAVVVSLAYGDPVPLPVPQPAPALPTPDPILPATTCQTMDCISQAGAMYGRMDTKTDPCTDFYQYSCGGWLEKNDIPSDLSSYSTLMQIYQDNLLTLKRILEDAPNTPSDLALAKLSNTYQACMDLDTIETAGATPLVPILGSIKALPSVSAPAFASLVAQLHRQGVYPFFYSDIIPDFKDPTIYVLEMGQAGLGLPGKGYYVGSSMSPALIAEYTAHMARMFDLGMSGFTGFDSTTDAATAVVAFETQLASLMLAPEQLRDADLIYNVINTTWLSTSAVPFQWANYYSAMNLATTGKLIATSPTYLSQMVNLVNGTETRVLQYYLGYLYIKSRASLLSTKFRQESFAYSQMVYGLDTQPPRWRDCVSRVDGTLGYMLGKYYVDRRFPGESRNTANTMIDNLMKSFTDNLPNLAWMTPATRLKAAEKANMITRKIGYPDWIYDPTQVQSYYQSTTADIHDYFGNTLSAIAASYARDAARLGQKVDASEWTMTPPTVNAYYNPLYNHIVFPAGIMQPPLFGLSQLRALNYGAVGTVIGHELTHGFDDQGRKFDGTGRLNPWWDSQSIAAFQVQANCIRDQYSQYQVNGENVNGQLTLGENIADNGGIQESFRAFKASGWEQTLPGIGLSSEQLFFVSFAQVWCGRTTPEEAHRRITVDPHSPPRYRVIGSVVNSPDFAAAFQCPAGSPMNPVNKCLVW